MADAIIVLGAALSSQTMRMQNDLRADKAAALYHARVAPHIIVSGAKTTEHPLSEAEYLARRLVSCGVVRRAIIIEDQATTTVGNAVYATRIMRKRGWHSAVIVTSPHHLARARYIFERVAPAYRFSCISSRWLPLLRAVPRALRDYYAYAKLRTRRFDLTRARL